MFILTGEFSSSLRKHIYFPKEDKSDYSLQCLFNCKEALQVERSPPITKRHISEHPGLLCCPCPLILWTVHQIVNSLLLPTCLEDGRMEGSHRRKIMWQQRQPLGLFRGACAERTTQENKGELLYHFNYINLPGASVQVPWSRRFYGAKWQRTKEGQDLWAASGKLPRTAQPHLPLKSLLWSEGILGSLPSPALLWHGTALRGRDFAKHWLFCPVSPLFSSSCPNGVTPCQQAGWGGWGKKVFIIAKDSCLRFCLQLLWTPHVLNNISQRQHWLKGQQWAYFSGSSLCGCLNWICEKLTWRRAVNIWDNSVKRQTDWAAAPSRNSWRFTSGFTRWI